MLKGKAPLVIALVLALLAGVIAYSAVQRQMHKAREGWNLIPVVVAAEDLPEGTAVTFDMIQQRSVPEQFITSSVIKPDSASYIVNQRTLVPLQKGDPLLWSQFETTRASEKLSPKLMTGFRAFTIESAGPSAVGGWVKPNDHVDVLGTFRDPNTNEQMAITLLQNVVVLATGKMTGTTNVNLIPEGQRDYSNVSLLVNPTEAEMLLLASEMGTLKLSLRHENDLTTVASNEGMNLKAMLNGERRKLMNDIRIKNQIDVIRGNSSAEKNAP